MFAFTIKCTLLIQHYLSEFKDIESVRVCVFKRGKERKREREREREREGEREKLAI